MSVTLAKLTAPRVNNLHQHNRLNKLLSSALNHPVIWVTSPAGAGKTSYVTSYIHKKKLDMVWYQLDEGDTDIASFLLHNN